MTKDEMGALQREFTGVHYDGTNYHYMKKGVRVIIAGLYEADGYYYYVNGNNGTLYVNQTGFSVAANRANGLVPAGKYDFDSQGRLSTPLINKDTEIQIPTTNPISKEDITVLGRAIDVEVKDEENSVACKVVYKSGSTYVVAEVTKTDAGYSFATEVGATDIQFVVSGDTDGNGKVETEDVTALQQDMLGKKDAGAAGKLAGDINGDGKLTIADIVLLNAASKGRTDIKW
jgi:hypothetical protein